MANFAVTDWFVEEPNITDCMAALETYLETIDDAKTIHLIGMDRRGDHWTAYVLHGA
jgi:hypothetical protein